MIADILTLPCPYQRLPVEVLDELHAEAAVQLGRERARLRHEHLDDWTRAVLRHARERSGLSVRQFTQAIGDRAGVLTASHLVQALQLAGLDLVEVVERWREQP